MEFRKMVMITPYARQHKRHRCIKQSYGLCGWGQGWGDLGEWYWNMYIIICEMNRQSRFDAWYKMLKAGVLRWPRGMVWRGKQIPVVDSYQCRAKPIHYCKVISLQLNKFILKIRHEYTYLKNHSNPSITKIYAAKIEPEGLLLFNNV